jgi:hypothetical protein
MRIGAEFLSRLDVTNLQCTSPMQSNHDPPLRYRTMLMRDVRRFSRGLVTKIQVDSKAGVSYWEYL